MTTSAPGPSSVGESVGLRLVGIGRILQRQYEAELSEIGLTLRHLGALGHISRHPEVSYSDLARRSHVTSQSMNATVKALEEIDAVQRSLPGHGHAARLEVTAKGHELLQSASAAATRLDGNLAKNLLASEWDTLTKLLGTLDSPSRTSMR
jgi:DNA-binding MarR family transcriptional regulator